MGYRFKARGSLRHALTRRPLHTSSGDPGGIGSNLDAGISRGCADALTQPGPLLTPARDLNVHLSGATWLSPWAQRWPKSESSVAVPAGKLRFPALPASQPQMIVEPSAYVTCASRPRASYVRFFTCPRRSVELARFPARSWVELSDRLSGRGG